MHRLITRLATACALLGGVVLCLLIAMICVSIAGRALAFLGTGPVRGDFELTEMGIALAVFCFLPLAQLRGDHAAVDLFFGRLPVRVQRVLAALWEIAMTAVAILILWRLYEGMQDRLRYNDTSYLLRIPLWIPYAAALLPAAVAVIVSAYVGVGRVLGVFLPGSALAFGIRQE
jgi:TRAP-type C4-dicarboxylate transport system permease small subunit